MASTAVQEPEAPGLPRVLLGARPRTAVIALAVGAFATYKLGEALAGPPLIWQDSLFYEKVGRAAVTSAGFWTGHFPPLVPLLWKLTGTDTSFVVAQTVLSILAWSASALILASRLRRGWAQVLTVLLVLTLASSQYVIEWDRSILSETTTLALVALFVATLVGFASRASRAWFGAVVLSALAMVEARDSNIATVALAGLGVAVAALYVYGRRSPRRVLALGASLFLVAVLAETASAVAGRDSTYTVDDLYVRVFPYPARDAFFARHGMPEASLVEGLAATTPRTPGMAPVVVPSGAGFAALTRWIDGGHATGTYVLWLLSHPVFLVGAPFASPAETFNDAGGNLAFYSAQGSPATPALDTALFRWWASAATAALALALALWRGTWRSRSWQAAAALAALGLVTMLIAWQAEGQEVTRHILEGSVQVRLAVLFLLALALGPMAGVAPDGSGHDPVNAASGERDEGRALASRSPAPQTPGGQEPPSA